MYLLFVGYPIRDSTLAIKPSGLAQQWWRPFSRCTTRASSMVTWLLQQLGLIDWLTRCFFGDIMLINNYCYLMVFIKKIKIGYTYNLDVLPPFYQHAPHENGQFSREAWGASHFLYTLLWVFGPNGEDANVQPQIHCVCS